MDSPSPLQQHQQQKERGEPEAKDDVTGLKQQQSCEQKPEKAEEVAPQTEESPTSEPKEQQKTSEQPPPEGKEPSLASVPISHGLLPAGISLLYPSQRIMPPPLIPIPGGGGVSGAKSDGNPLPNSAAQVSVLVGRLATVCDECEG